MRRKPTSVPFTGVIITGVLASLLTAGLHEVRAQSQQRASPQAERANAEIARRLGQLTIDNAHLASAVESLLEQLHVAQVKQKEAAQCPE